MQSQRLAKSVSQALVGSPQAFPEVKESAEVLAAQRARPEAATAACAGADRSAGRRRQVVPLVERAEKNAGTVHAPAEDPDAGGPALRTINRQSSDLLEMAETVSSLKLQQDATPAEISARRPAGDADAADRQVGQRIPDHRRREPRSGVPARQGPELVPARSRKGLLDGSARAAPARHARTRRRASAWTR